MGVLMHPHQRRGQRCPRPVACAACLVGGLLLLSCPRAAAQSAQISQTMGLDPRGLGLGSAYAAVASGPFSTAWNPAGLAQERGLSLCPVSYRELLPGFDNDVHLYGAGVTAALEPVAAGLVYSRLDYGTVEGTNEESSEWNLHVGLGVDLARQALHAPEHVFWGVGGAYKIARAHLFSTSGSPLAGSGWDVDLGTLFGIRLPLTDAPPSADRASCSVRVGITAFNVLQNEMDFEDDSSAFESSFHFAVASDIATAPIPPFDGGAQFLVTYESVRFVGDAADLSTEHRFGIETTLLDLASVRIGYAGDDRLGEHVTYGFSLGGPRSWVRLDFASIPGFGRVEHFALVVLVPY